MSLTTNIQNGFTRVATEIKNIKNYISGSGTGDVSGLDTSATNLVGAINELKALIAGLGSGDMSASTYDPQGINNDSFDRSNMTGTQTASTISDFTTQVNSLAQSIVDGVIDSAPGALDTLNELAAALGDDPNFASTINASLSTKVRFDAAQLLTGEEQTTARNNIDTYGKSDIGDVNTNYVTTFEAGLS